MKLSKIRVRHLFLNMLKEQLMIWILMLLVSPVEMESVETIWEISTLYTHTSQQVQMIQDQLELRRELEVFKDVNRFVSRIQTVQHSISTCSTLDTTTTVGSGPHQDIWQMDHTRLTAMLKTKTTSFRILIFQISLRNLTSQNVLLTNPKTPVARTDVTVITNVPEKELAHIMDTVKEWVSAMPIMMMIFGSNLPTRPIIQTSQSQKRIWMTGTWNTILRDSARILKRNLIISVSWWNHILIWSTISEFAIITNQLSGVSLVTIWNNIMM